jgi:HlyD family secretion protein
MTGGALCAVPVLLVVGFLWRTGTIFSSPPFTGPTAVVQRKILQVTVVARGNLESARNGDIVCSVRSGTKGSTNASTIKFLLDNGTEVKKGDKVIELDDSGLQEQLKSQNIDTNNAEADWVKAKEQYSIDEIQAQSDIEKAVNARDLAKIDLDKYKEGDYPQALKDVDGRIETCRSDLEDWKDRAAWSLRMAKKGLMSKVQADADASRRDASQIALAKVEEEKRVLVDYTFKRTVTDLTAKLKEAERTLEKTTIQSKSTLASDDAARKSKQSVYEQQYAKKKEYEGEILKCVVLAPQDGLVVYYVPEQVKGGGGSQQSIVAQGEPVREGQKMMQIPDLSNMLVNVRVPEAMVSYLHNEPSSKDPSSWQKAQIKVDAFPNRILHGHIKTIDTVASQFDFFASDVKVYKTMVAMDQQVDGLKPGMSAEVTIYAQESSAPILVVPVQAVLGTISSGADRKCFVVGPDGQPKMRDIVVGMSNEREVEVKSGLEEGERVVENPQKLVTEGSDLKQGKVRSKSDEQSQGDGDSGKKGKKGKGAGAGPDAYPGAPGGGAAGAVEKSAGGPPSQEMMQAFMQQMENATPEARRDRLNMIPDTAARDKARQYLQGKGLKIAD